MIVARTKEHDHEDADRKRESLYPMLRQTEIVLERKAFFDHMKSLETDVLAQLLDSYTLTLLLIDIDRMSTINGSYGHAIGDSLLDQVIVRLRSTDGCVSFAKMGGDQYAMLLHVPVDEFVISRIDRVMMKIKEPFFIEEHELYITVSIGWRSLTRRSVFHEILEQAEIAMYYAKKKGGDNWQIYDPDMSPHDGMEIEKRLHRALYHHEFLLYYQPQFHTASGELTGLEILLRWNNPDLGLVLPSVFIPMAERTGMIVTIGQWVLEEACRQRRIWYEMGFTQFRIAVNLSARQFQQPNLAQMIEDTLRRTRLDPTLLELEITETIAMANVEQTFRTLTALAKIGVRLSIDDFGTGYSSLSYLCKFPIHRLKIDQSFLRDIPRAKEGMEVTRAIISLAHNLQLTVIAEGVETIEQLNFLYENQCDEMQGYFLSRPLTLQATEQFIAKLPNDESIS